MDNSRSLFVPFPSVVTPQTRTVGRNPSISNSRLVNNNNNSGSANNNMIDRITGVYNAIPQEAKDRFVRVVADSISTRGGNNGGKGGRGGKHHSSGYSLSKAPIPKVTALDTGISPNTRTHDYLDAKEGDCAPLHITKCHIHLPDVSSSTLNRYFMDIIAFDIQTKAQANTGFNLKVETDFTATKIYNAMQDLLHSLQVYFFVASVISYHSDSSNKNEGMIYLRKQYGPDTIERLTQLNRRLSDTPCPPRLLELVRYMSGTYYSGDNQGSALLKTSPISTFDNAATLAAIQDSINKLASPVNNSIYSLLRRTVPQWQPIVLYDVDPIPVYDANYLTIFANLPFNADDGITLRSHPTVAAEDTDFAYNSFSNELDGAAFALCSANVTGLVGQYPGLIHTLGGVNATARSTRVSYYSINGLKQFHAATNDDFLSRSRPETFQTSDNGVNVVALHLAGADKCMGVNTLSIQDTAVQVLEYMMSLDTIKVEKRVSSFSGKGRRKGNK